MQLRCTPALQEKLAPGAPRTMATLAPVAHAKPKDDHGGCGCGGAKGAALSPAMLVALGALAGAIIILAIHQ